MAHNKDLKKIRSGIRLDPQATAPTNAEKGAIYVDSNGDLQISDGFQFNQVGFTASAVNYLERRASGDSIQGWTKTGDDITFATNASSPLRGANDFKITVGAGSASTSENIYYDMTIDDADKNKNLLFSFDFKFAGTNVATRDEWDVIIKDNTSGTELTIGTLSKVEGTFYGTYKTQTTSSYRIIIKCKGTTTDYTLQMDNFFGGIASILKGPVIDDWQDYTTQVTGPSSTTNTAKYRRVGDSVEIQVKVLGTTAGTSTTLDIGLPDNLDVDTDKLLIVNGPVGTGTFLDGAVSKTVKLTYQAQRVGATQAKLRAKVLTVSGSDLVDSSNLDLDASDYIEVTAKVPIQNWESESENSILLPNSIDQGDVGEIVIWAADHTASTPKGCLLCDGSSKLRADYPALFDVIGTTYGSADGSHFNLPDYRGYFLRARDGGAGIDGDAGTRTDRGDTQTGDKVGTKQLQATKVHNHGVTQSSSGGHSHTSQTITDTGSAHTHNYNDKYTTAGSYTNSGAMGNTYVIDDSRTTGSTGSAHSHTSQTITETGSDHTHTISIDNTSGGDTSANETRPSNVAVDYYIRFQSRMIPSFIGEDLPELKTSVDTNTANITSNDTDIATNTTAIALNTTHRGVSSGNPHSVTASDVGLGNVTNESKATMFADAALTGDSTAVTQSASDNSTKIATTAYTDAAVAAGGGGGSGVITHTSQSEINSYTPTPGDTIICTGGGDYSAKTLEGVRLHWTETTGTLILGDIDQSYITSRYDMKFEGSPGSNVMNSTVKAYNYIDVIDNDMFWNCDVSSRYIRWGNKDSPHDLDSSIAQMSIYYSKVFGTNMYFYPDDPNNKTIRAEYSEIRCQNGFAHAASGIITLGNGATLIAGFINGWESDGDFYCADTAHIQCFGNTSSTSSTYHNLYNIDGSSAYNTTARARNDEFSLRKATYNSTSPWE